MSLREYALAPLLAVAACTLRPYEFQASETDGTGATSTTSTATTSTSGTATTAPTSAATTGTSESITTGIGSSTSGSDFIIGPDHSEAWCDVWAQDCPEGQKCAAVSLDGDNSWETHRCVPVVPDPAQYNEPCSYLGSTVGGEDTCDKGLMCWDLDPDTLEGKCITLCDGPFDAPTCAVPNTTCTISAEHILIICLPTCDPYAFPCWEPDTVCVPDPEQPDGYFHCVPDARGVEGQAFDPCDALDACDPGLVCVPPGFALECDPMAQGCCLPACYAGEPGQCPGQGQECISFYHPDPAPVGYSHLGICRLP